MRRLFAKLTNLLLPRRAEREMQREIAAHLALMRDDLERQGLAPDEAEAAARRAWGGIEQTKELHRHERSLPWLEDFLKDIAYGWRGLMRNRGFTTLAVAALALGIGANAAIFGVFNATFLKPLPVEDPAHVVRVKRWFRHNKDDADHHSFSLSEYRYLRDRTSSFSAIVASSDTVAVGVGPNRVEGRVVSPNYFAGLGIRPLAGHLFGGDEAGAVIVISYRYWRDAYRSDPNVVGRTLQLNGEPYAILGVTPREFQGTDPSLSEVSFWAPLARYDRLAPATSSQRLEHPRNPGARDLHLLARLRSGVSRAQAQAETTGLLARYLAPFHETEPTTAVTFADTSLLGESTTFEGFGIVVTVVSLLLLVACANVANMSLARGMSRQREMGLRMALGSTRGRAVRQLLTESILLACMGGAMGIAFSAFASGAIWNAWVTAMSGYGFPVPEPDFAPDLRMFGYGLALALAAGLIFGLVPALRFSRIDPNTALKDHDEFLGLPRARSRMSGMLLGFQVAVSVALLMMSGVALSKLRKTVNADPGFDTRNIWMLLGSDEKLRQRLATLPEVAAIAAGDVPLAGNVSEREFKVGDDTDDALVTHESEGFFEVMGIPIVRGRAFTRTEAEHSAPVAVVSALTARGIWPGQDPLGKRLALDIQGKGKFTDVEIVGVAKDVHFESLTELDSRHVYLPLGAQPAAPGKPLIFRIRGDRDRALTAVRGASETSDIILVGMESGPVAAKRSLARLFATCAGVLTLLSLAVAAVGIYGVLAFLVAQRTREIGIRVALGATRGRIVRRVLTQGLRPAAIGAAVGFGAVAGLNSLDGDVIGKPITFADPTAYGLLLVVAIIAAAASLAPALRAMRIDPVESLRHE